MNEQDDEVAHPGNGNNTSQATVFRPIWQFAIDRRHWQGWHHHVTMVMLAHAFLTLETLRSKKNFWLDPAEDAT
jgi:hypothetical protein